MICLVALNYFFHAKVQRKI